MSRATLGLLFVAALTLLPGQGFAAKPGSGAGNIAPSVRIVSPGSGSRFDTGATIAISADAQDSDGRISRVAFYAGATFIGSRSKKPFSISWSDAPAGTHVLTAVATDSARASTTSAGVTIQVATAADALAPSVPAGLNSPSQSQSGITLAWSASSDSDSGVAGYDVFRDGALVASPAQPAYADAGLTAGQTYRYAVRARDNAGNASAQSAALSVQTLAAGTTDPGTPEAPASSKRVVGYFTQWGIYSNGYTAKSLDQTGVAERLTHLIYAFGNVRNNRCELGVLKPTNTSTGEGGDAWADYARPFSAAESVDGVADKAGQPLRGHWNQLRKLKQQHPDLKIMISLGGWTWSRGFASAARPENREAFVESCIDGYIHGNLPAFDGAGGSGAAAELFDGFDIDWEYPAACGLTCGNSEDTENFTQLLAEFRRQLDAVRPGLQLSTAVGAGIDKIRVTRPAEYQSSVDFINLMTYDFHGAWESRTNFHTALFGSPDDPSLGDARLYNSDDAVKAFLDLGVPGEKLNLGIASYGRGWTNVSSRDNGLYQSGVPAPGSLEAGIESYRKLAALNHPSFVDPKSLAHWTFNGSTFWNFDTPASIADKMNYVDIQGLGGAFLWDFAGDDEVASLMHAIGDGLR